MPANAHRMLEASWSGTTKFRQAAEYMEDVVDVGVDDDTQKQLIAQSDIDEKTDEEHEPTGRIGSLVLRERLVGDGLLSAARLRSEPGSAGAGSSDGA